MQDSHTRKRKHYITGSENLQAFIFFCASSVRQMHFIAVHMGHNMSIQDLALCHRTQIKFPLCVWNLHFFGEHPPSPRLDLTSAKTRQLKVSPPSWPSCLPLPGLSSPVCADTGGMVQIFPCTSGPNVKQKCSCWSLMFESTVFQRLSDQKHFHSCFLMSNLPPRAFGAMPNLCNRLLCKREVPGRGWLNSYNATQLKPHDYINFWSLLAVLFGRLADFCSLHAVSCSVTRGNYSLQTHKNRFQRCWRVQEREKSWISFGCFVFLLNHLNNNLHKYKYIRGLCASIPVSLGRPCCSQIRRQSGSFC